MPLQTAFDLTAKDIGGLPSPDAVAGFFTRLGYPTGCRKELTPASAGLTGDTAQAVASVELTTDDPDSTHEPTFCYTPASIRCWACNVVPDGSMLSPTDGMIVAV